MQPVVVLLCPGLGFRKQIYLGVCPGFGNEIRDGQDGYIIKSMDHVCLLVSVHLVPSTALVPAGRLSCWW